MDSDRYFEWLSLLAQVDLREVSKHWGGGNKIPLEWVGIAIGVVLLIIGGLSLQRWWRQRHLRPRPTMVFHQVARAMGLGWADQWLLMRIARQQGLPSPLTLMLSATTLRHHADGYAQGRGLYRRSVILRRVAAIRRSLFGARHGRRRAASPEPTTKAV